MLLWMRWSLLFDIDDYHFWALTYFDVPGHRRSMSELTPTPVRRGLARPLLVAAMLAASVLGAGLVTSGGGRAEAAAAPGTSVPSPTVTAPNPSPFPPNPPTNLTATTVKSTSITLTWTASTRGCCAVTGYDINYYELYNDVVYRTSVGNVTTATLTSYLRPTGQYRISVTAHDDLGHTSLSSTSILVVTPVSDSASDTTPPSAPDGLTVYRLSATTVALNWAPATDNVAVIAYDVYRMDNFFMATRIAMVTGNSYIAALGTGPNQFYIRARDAAGNVSASSALVGVPGPSTSPTDSPTASPTDSPTASPTAQPGCRVSYTNLSQWSGGFVAGITITNTGATRLSGWTLTYTFGGDQRITSSWNATFSQSGAAVTLRNADWNGTVQPGASVSLGTQGTWHSSLAAPGAFALGGVACALG